MTKLLKYLKGSALSIVAVVILLILQASCDLSLPSYTSDIVNIGIQQGGIDSNVPKAMRESVFQKLSTLLEEEDRKVFTESYELLNEEDLSMEEYQEAVENYPVLKEENVYVLKKDASIDELSECLKIPELLVYFAEENPEKMQEYMQAQQEMGAQAPDMTAFDSEEIPETIIDQMTIAFVKAEYEAVGMDVEQMQTKYILWTGAKMLLLALLTALAAVCVTFIASRVAAKVSRDLRSQVFHKVVGFSNVEMDKFSTASLITRSTNDIQQVQMLIVMMLRMVIYAPILAFGGVIKILNTNTSMTWILGVGVAAILVVVMVLFITVMPRFKVMQKMIDRLNLVMREIITGIPVIRAFSTERYEEKRFDGANRDLTKTMLFVNRVMTCMMPLMMLIMNLLTILIVWVGAGSIDKGNMQVGDMMAFIQYAMQIIMSFLMISMMSIMLPRASVSAERIDEILTTDEVIKDKKEPEKLPEKKGVLTFEHVHFRFPNATEDALEDLNFTANPGETTAIIGSTGSGKSTLVNLIPRFYDVTEGSIRLDGVDIRNITQHELRSNIGYVPQKGVLFSGTVESNIKFGDETKSSKEVERAAMIAQAKDFIEEKPQKYEEPIAQGGTNVSGGQKQRLSIARAVAMNPQIYIFDDSFSALDYKTDVALRRALKGETEGSTVIIVAQRISTIMNAEQILVLDEGKIVGKGTHKELLENCEVYRQIASSQLSEKEIQDSLQGQKGGNGNE